MKQIGVLLFLVFNLLFGFAQVQKDTSVSKKAGVSVELALNMCIGGGSNNAGDAELTNLSYESYVSPAGKVDTIKYKLGAGLTGGFDLNLMFGKKRSIGFSVGVLVVGGFNSFKLDSFEMQYKAQDKEGRSFRRILSAYTWKEKITYTNVSIPVLLKLRYHGKKRIGFFADIGPVITVFSNAKSKIETTIDFEAVYSMNGGTPHFSEQTESTDWIMTRDMIKKHISTGGQYNNANEYFDQQYSRGYYVGLEKNKTGTAPIVDYKIGFGGLLRAGMIYKIKPFLSISLGGQCLIVSSGRKTSSSYKPLDVQNDFENGGSMNSLLNSAGSLLKAQYGLNIGLHIKVVK